MHEGHRKRLLEKLKNGDSLFEHELLEILLFNAYPRKNVNPVAHALLKRFPCINEILNAEVEELTAVEGVGENVALYLKCIGECLRYKSDSEGFASVKNTAELIAFVTARMRGFTHEVLELYFMDKSGVVRRICSFTERDPDRVRIRPEEIIKLISVVRPYGLYIAHNHVMSPCAPSEADDDITKKLQLICSLNNVRLYDHVIYTSGGVYSYFLEGRLDKIACDYSAANYFSRK